MNRKKFLGLLLAVPAAIISLTRKPIEYEYELVAYEILPDWAVGKYQQCGYIVKRIKAT